MRATSRSCKAAAMSRELLLLPLPAASRLAALAAPLDQSGGSNTRRINAQIKMGRHGPTSLKLLPAAAPAWPPVRGPKNEKPLGGASTNEHPTGPRGTAGWAEASGAPPTEGAHSTAGAPRA